MPSSFWRTWRGIERPGDYSSRLLLLIDGIRANEAIYDSATAGREFPLRAAAVVDASGRVGLLARRFSLRRPEPALANIAIFSHYSGVPRREGRAHRND